MNKSKPYGSLARMSEDELVAHIEKYYSGKSISEIKKESPSVEQHIRRKNLLKTLVAKGTVVQKQSRTRPQKSRWSTQEDWQQYGVNRGYVAQGPGQISISEDKNDRAWYRKGWLKGWVNDFPFTGKREESKLRYNSFGEWKKHGLECGYHQRNPASLEHSQDIDERAWYAKSQNNGWRKRFPFSRKRVERSVREDLRNIRKELEKIIGENDGKFPTREKLAQLKKHSLLQGIAKNGGLIALRKTMGYDLTQRENGYWDSEDAIVGELMKAMEEKNWKELPGSWTLRRSGYGAVVGAVDAFQKGKGWPYFRALVHGRLGVGSELETRESLLEQYIED